MAKKCSPGKFKIGFINELSKQVKKFIDTQASGVDRVDALKLIRLKLDAEKAEIFDEVVENLYNENVEEYLDENQQIDISLVPEFFMNFMKDDFDVNSIDFGIYADAIQPDADESADIEDRQVENLKNPGVNLGQASSGTKMFDAFYVSAIGRRLAKFEYKNLLNFVNQYNDFDTFLTRVLATYLPNQETLSDGKLRHLKIFYRANRAVNKIKYTMKNRFVYTNLNVDSIIKDPVKDIVNNIKTGMGFIKKTVVNLKTKLKTPDFEIASFLDGSDRQVRGYNINNKQITASFSLNEMVKIIKTRAGGWFSRPAVNSKDINSATLQGWEMALYNMVNQNGDPAPMTIVSMTPGDTGTVFLARILPSQVNEFFSMEDFVQSIVPKLISMDAAILANFINNYSKTDGTIVRLIQGLANRVNKPYQKGDNLTFTKSQKEKIYAEIVNSLKEIAVNPLKAYLDKQIKEGNMTKEHANKFYAAAGEAPAYTNVGEKTAIFPLHLSGMIAKYEWLQAVRGKNFLMGPKGDNAFNIFDRLRINNSKGLTTEGLGDSRHIIYDQEKVEYWYEGVKYEHMVDIPGIKGITNIIDGASFSSDQYLDNTAENIGTDPIFDNEHNIREIKSAYQEVTVGPNGKESYIEKKHAEHSAIPGLEIRTKRKDGKKGSLIVEMKTEYGQTVIVAKNGKYVDQVSDLDAVKTVTGIYDLKGVSHSERFKLKENSRKIIITPHTRSADDVYGPTQYVQSLNFNLTGENQKNLEKYEEVLLDIILSQSNLHLDQYLEASKDPNTLWNMVKHMFSEQTNIKTGLIKHLTVSKGKGIYHPNNIMQLRPIILNMLIKRGAFQGRTYNSKLTPRKGALAGSQYTMKPGRDVQEGSVILSADNHAIFDAVRNEMGNPEATVEEVNIWLENNPKHVITYRSPVLQIAALESRKIQQFVEGEGNAIYHHPSDTFVRLVGDHDIDKAATILVNDDQAKKLQDFHNTAFFKAMKETNADIGIIKKNANLSILSNKETRQAMLDIINSYGSQGLAANLKSVASTISKKIKKIEFSEVRDGKASPDGVVVKPKQLWSDDPKEMVIMDYAPLRDDVTQDDIPGYAEIVDINGNPWKPGTGDKFLKTFAEHEFLLIANAAVDNLKTGILTNVMGARNPDWYIKRMFTVVKGTLSKHHIKILKQLARKYTYSQLRSLRTDKTGTKMGTERLFKELEDMYNDRNASPEDQAKLIIDQINTKPRKMTPKKGGKGTEVYHGIFNIEMTGGVTAEEKILLLPYERLLLETEKDPEMSDQLPLLFGDNRLEMTHYLAAGKLFADFNDNEMSNYTKSEIEQGLIIATEFVDEYFGEFKEKNVQPTKDKKEAEDTVINKQAEFDEALFNITLKYAEKIEMLNSKYGKGVGKIATLYMLSGVANRKNVRYLPPMEVMDNILFDQYMELWEQSLFERDNDGNLISMKYEDKEIYKSIQMPWISALNKSKREC